MPQPLPNEYAPFYATYVRLVPQEDALSAILTSTPLLISFFSAMPADLHDYAYAPGKWTIKQVLQHMTDAERIFAYRALRFARADKSPLAGWEESDYAKAAQVSHLNWQDMIDEFTAVRKASEYLFKSFGDAELQRSGEANGSGVTVNSLGFILTGHAYHHKRIIEERYL